jgi:carbonic anhydrase/acetyltransferase-like protein (isoleucine patch superfamily)
MPVFEGNDSITRGIGGARIGTATFIGSNAASKEYTKIGNNLVIGFGSKITNHIDHL